MITCPFAPVYVGREYAYVQKKKSESEESLILIRIRYTSF